MTLPFQLLRRYRRRVFIETGTYQGGGVALALQVGCREVHSVESDRALFRGVYRRYRRRRSVHLYHGSSPPILREILGRLREEAVFWLDAHEFGGGRSPLMAELRVIGTHPIKSHVIMIDDRKVFRDWGLKYREVKAALLRINPEYRIDLRDSRLRTRDIIVARQPTVPRRP